MKFSLVSFLAISGSAAAFAPASKPSTVSTSLHSTSTTRGDFLNQVATLVVAGGLSTAAFPSAANAGWATGPGSAVLDPKEAIIDDDVLKSSPVQQALQEVSGYAALVSDMKESLKKDSQVNLGPIIKKKFDFGKLRADLNTLNSAFDEETQRGTDRLIRGILQDLTELEVANAQKDGVPRSDIRVAKMNAKLDKLQDAFNEYLKFAKA
mmetsp:Transcript_21020/g.33830  ORF Transcript_21020/g.33830 Transcript_21020/m.33830 type:complete len:209 (-) Transcript_21020:191-817(-)|eukprot:CAMPEP_0178749828 /NCGR_PEP_ID=MMETSP0744-20121128/9615_1 /TAXON_ID=913974 /ORGANISM="Nitzschia punctata, Strain CCMP561" /LENGTH=208 /DNA_ID=CAMNT_0020403261 /DNA_START=42 /DNA_END=668 /DNA_ORIENTATION=+